MSRANREKRAARRLLWRKWNGYACVQCGCDLDDEDLDEEDLDEEVDPREPRPCMEHCGQPVWLEKL